MESTRNPNQHDPNERNPNSIKFNSKEGEAQMSDSEKIPGISGSETLNAIKSTGAAADRINNEDLENKKKVPKVIPNEGHTASAAADTLTGANDVIPPSSAAQSSPKRDNSLSNNTPTSILVKKRSPTSEDGTKPPSNVGSLERQHTAKSVGSEERQYPAKSVGSVERQHTVKSVGSVERQHPAKSVHLQTDLEGNNNQLINSLVMTDSPLVAESLVSSPSTQSPYNTMSSSRKKREKSDREVLIGTPVKEGHVNYMLMYDMLTGIRISVSRCNAKPMRELYDSDYTSAHKLAFDVTGNEMTPSSKYDFKFKDYCPWVFRLIREAFHVDPAYYLLSLTGKYVLSELISSGKSGSFFYYSSDYRFIIKTIHHSEHKYILKSLRQYYNHIKENPHTLLSRIFGLHRVKLPGNRKIHFVVMGNVFPANKDIHEVYDLKGSLFGRKISEEEAKSNPRAVMKDLNWMERKKKLNFGPEKKVLFEKQMDNDVSFLMSQGIMDYSLLIGIHDTVRGNQEHIRDQTLSVFEPNSDALSRRATASTRKTKQQIFKEGVKSDLVQLGPSTSKLPENIPPERRYCYFYSDEGGFRGSDENNQPSKEIYYLGIIDIFTYYNTAKRVETAWRSIRHEKNIISAVDPNLYGNRFKKFMLNAFAALDLAITPEQWKRAQESLKRPSGSYTSLPVP